MYNIFIFIIIIYWLFMQLCTSFYIAQQLEDISLAFEQIRPFNG